MTNRSNRGKMATAIGYIFAVLIMSGLAILILGIIAIMIKGIMWFLLI